MAKQTDIVAKIVGKSRSPIEIEAKNALFFIEPHHSSNCYKRKFFRENVWVFRGVIDSRNANKG